jgi:hypothetical protein
MFPFNCPPDVCGGGYIDSSCVLYHLAGVPPSKLVNLNLPNGVSAQVIFEAIDALLGTAISGQTIVPVSTPGISFLGMGPGNRILTPTLLLSGASGQTASIKSDGLYVPDLRDGKVKINSTDFPDYLLNKVVGATDGIVSVSFVLDPSGSNLAAIIPSLNVVALANNALFDTTLANNNTFTTALANNAEFDSELANNSNFVNDLAGNSTFISALSPHISGSTAANNGLSVSGSNVQLGGPLIKNTTIGFASLYNLTLNGSPILYMGEGSVGTNATLQVAANYPTRNIGILGTNSNSLGAVGIIGINGNAIIQGGTDTDNSLKAGMYGQIFFNSGNAPTLNAAEEVAYTGVVGLVTTYGAGTTVAGAMVSNVTGIGFAADGVDVSGGWASFYAKGAYQAPQGGAYTGTVTNYYGLYVEDLSQGLGSSITNKYAIYQAGTGDVSRFFGAVQNAGGSTQFTSDARIKENFHEFERGLNEIEQLNTKTYNYTYNKGRVVTGIIAQDVEQIMPEAVEKGHFETPDGTEYSDFRMVDQNVIFYAMINAIKELSATNRSLNKRLTSLEGAK